MSQKHHSKNKKSKSKSQSSAQKTAKTVENSSSEQISEAETAELMAVLTSDDTPVEVVYEQAAIEEPVPTKLPWLHRLNVRFPWLKIVVLASLVLVLVFGTERAIRYNLAQTTMNPGVAQSPSAPDGLELEGLTGMLPTPEETEESEDAARPETPAPSAPENVATAPPGAPTGGKLIALTFDDGPSAHTPRLLQILREKQVKVTFFVIGIMADKLPEVLRQEAAEGHEIGSHTMTHANLKRVSAAEIQSEIDRFNALFQRELGRSPAITRPPYGNINENVRALVPTPLILWTVDTEDWKNKNATETHDRALSAAFDGAIILMHDVYSTTVDAVPRIIDDLRAQGYELVTVSELARRRKVDLKAGWSYGSFRPE